MKLRTCDVSAHYPRVDLLYDGILFRGAAIHGSGGIMGEGAPDAWAEIPTRLRRLAGRREMVSVATRASESGRFETFDAPAALCKLLAVYAPKYDPGAGRGL